MIDIWFLAEPESQSTGASAESQTQVGQVWLATCGPIAYRSRRAMLAWRGACIPIWNGIPSDTREGRSTWKASCRTCDLRFANCAKIRGSPAPPSSCWRSEWRRAWRSSHSWMRPSSAHCRTRTPPGWWLRMRPQTRAAIAIFPIRTIWTGRRSNTSFSSFEAWDASVYLWRSPEGVQAVRSAHVSGGFFRSLGVTAMLGRVFADDRRHARRAAHGGADLRRLAEPFRREAGYCRAVPDSR